MVQVAPQEETKTEGLPTDNSNQIPKPPSSPTGEAVKKPAIRTMKSDIDELLKNSRLTVSQMIGPTGNTIYSSASPTKLKKIFLLTAGAILLIVVGFYLYPKIKGGMNEMTVQPMKISAPPPLFATEHSRTITVNENDRLQLFNLVLDSVKEQEIYGSMKRLVVKIKGAGGQERYATMAEFLDFYRIKTPANLAGHIAGPAMVFVYYGQAGNRFGIATRTHDTDRSALAMYSWESALAGDMRPFFFEAPFGEISFFEDRSYRNIDWRFLKSSVTEDLGVGYAIFPAQDVLVISTSKEALETSIDRLFEAR